MFPDEEDVRIITVDSSFSTNPISFNILENGKI